MLLKKTTDNFLTRLEAVRPFTEPDAWRVYRLAAFGEAFGWTLLIVALLIRHYRLPGHDAAVPVGGQIHGILFLSYFGVLLAMYTSLRWSRKRFFLALVSGVPPYGSLIFEQWAAHKRRRHHTRGFLTSVVLTLASA